MCIYIVAVHGVRESDMTWRWNNNYIYVCVCTHIKYQDYTFVLAREVRERTEVSLLVYGTSLSQVIILGISKGGRGRRIGGRDRTSVLLHLGRRTHWPQKRRESKDLALRRPELALLPYVILSSL